MQNANDSDNVSVNNGERVRRVGRQKLYGEPMDALNMNLAPRTLERIKRVLRRGETQSELIRAVVERELERREREAEKKRK